MNDQVLAEGAVAAFGKAIGVNLPAEEIVQLGAFLVARFQRKSWEEATAAGVTARERIKTEADAERSRRERMAGP